MSPGTAFFLGVVTGPLALLALLALHFRFGPKPKTRGVPVKGASIHHLFGSRDVH